MKLADWLILADGKERSHSNKCSKEFCASAHSAYIQALANGKNPEEQERKAFSDCDCHAPPPPQLGSPLETYIEPDTYLPDKGTVFRWQGDDSYSTAVVTKNSVYMVKCVLKGVSYPKKHYQSYHAWRDDLPAGHVSTSEPNSSHERTQRLLRRIKEDKMTDVDAVTSIMWRFKIYSYALLEKSPRAKLEMFRKISEELCKAVLAKEEPVSDLSNYMFSSIEKYKQYLGYVATLTDAEKDLESVVIYPNGTGRLFVSINGEHVPLALHYAKDKTSLACRGRLADTFQELGADFENNAPVLYVLYRKKYIKIEKSM
jgi:hypothetical protein